MDDFYILSEFEEKDTNAVWEEMQPKPVDVNRCELVISPAKYVERF